MLGFQLPTARLRESVFSDYQQSEGTTVKVKILAAVSDYRKTKNMTISDSYIII